MTFISKESFRDGDAWLESGGANPPTGVVPGTPGHFTPVGCQVPTIAELQAGGPLGQTTPWAEGQWVDAMMNNIDPDTYPMTWISTPTTCSSSWVGGPLDHTQIKVGSCFPAEPTVTAQDQVNADKLTALGYRPINQGTIWSAGQNLYVGLYTFYWDGNIPGWRNR